MTLNASKCHLLVSGYKDELKFAKLGGELIWEEYSGKLLAMIIDSPLKFGNYVKMACKKASQRTNTNLKNVKLSVSVKDERKSFNSIICESHFHCGSLIWMFCGRHLNHRNKPHERALRITYNDSSSGFEELLPKDDTITIHQRDRRALAIEMYKISNDLSSSFMKNMITEICIP